MAREARPMTKKVERSMLVRGARVESGSSIFTRDDL